MNLLVSSLYRPHLLDRTSGSIFSDRNEGGLDNSTVYGGVRISGYEVGVLWLLLKGMCVLICYICSSLWKRSEDMFEVSTRSNERKGTRLERCQKA